jgi:PKD repeat protein
MAGLGRPPRERAARLRSAVRPPALARRTAHRLLIAVGALAATSLLVTAPPVAPAFAAGPAPAPPVLVAPANGATQVPAGQQLRVTATDADDASVNVSFYGRPSADTGGGTPNPAGDFTFAVIPDTQNYVSAAANRPIMGQQTQWLVDSRQALNTAFVTHLGDVVGIETSTTQWQAASGYMATLDNAGLPNTVLPGNHDINLTTGEAAGYNQYFPVSRYAGAAWNSPTASYGGYLGQNQFGTDPVNRQNMDNYALFTAGGMDFLLLNLEFNTPDYVIDWAKKVLAAYPDRRAIVATHSYVDYSGQLSTQMDRADGGNSPAQLWQKLISPSCSIFMVVSGHFHNGDLSEARRTDTNSCGRTVQAVLSDYQERIRGGDGWLRYYTFKPSQNQIQAVTYSPSLNRYETDADSAFTMPYDMSTGTAAFPKIGEVTVPSGATASIPVPTLPAGSGYQWYAAVSDATTTTIGPTWSFTTAPAPVTALAKDGFERTLTNAWGSADVGGSWSLGGGSTRFSVSAGDGVSVTPVGGTTTANLAAVSSTSADTSVQLRLDAVPNAVTHLSVLGRRVGSSSYSAKVRVNAAGVADLRLLRDNTDLTTGVPFGGTLAAGQRVAVRIQVQDTSPTTIRARAWKVGSTEPTTWTVSTTDSTAALQAPGSVQLSTYLSSAATTGPVTVRWDDLLVSPIGSTPPPAANVAPVAAFTSSVSGLQASVNGSGSSDADGTIASYAWAFGDGVTASGATATHAYAAAGSYPVTLTVTDDDGATGVRTSSVTVTAPPASTVIAADAFGRTVSGGWGSADTGGAWNLPGAANSSVTGGQGVQLLPVGTTTTATLAGVSSSATDLVVALGVDAVPVGGPVYASIGGRSVGSGDYSARAVISVGKVDLILARSGTALVRATIPGVSLAAGEKLLVRVQVQGTSPTTLRARAWKASAAEPTTWLLTTTDSTAALQVPGGIRLSTYVSSAVTNGPATIRYDNLSATRLN